MEPLAKTSFCLFFIVSVFLMGACDEHEPLPVVYAEGGVWEDPETGLIWQEEPTEKFVSWQAAWDYCDAVVLESHDDWRLPTSYRIKNGLLWRPNLNLCNRLNKRDSNDGRERAGTLRKSAA